MEIIQHKNSALFSPLHVGQYGQLGSGSCRQQLGRDLLFFLKMQKKSLSAYSGLLALFDNEEFFGDEFDAALWRELSFLEDSSPFNIVDAVADAVNDGFRFYFLGVEFFVSRQCPVFSCHSVTFSKPALVFKLMSQLETNSDISVVKYNLPIHQ